MTESIDVIAAYPQVVLGDNIKHCIIPECRRRVVPRKRERCSTSCDAQCVSAEELCAVLPDLVEISSCMSFAGWLIMDRWLTVPEAPTPRVLWHDGDDAGATKRAMKAREYDVSEERAGRNVLVRAAETFSAEPWREERWKTAESVTDALAHAKSVSGKKSSKCAIMTTQWTTVT